MENNATTTSSTGGFWSNLGSVLTNKAVDLADSYAAMKIGQKTAAQPAQTAPLATPTAPNEMKKWLWIGGIAAAAVVVLTLLLRRR